MVLALALKLNGVTAEIFEARERAAVRLDPRVLALSDGARQILEWLDVWPELSATPINTIHISQRGGFGRSCLRAAELDMKALGWVLAASDLIAALDAAVSAAGITYHDNKRVMRSDALHAGNSASLAGIAGDITFALTAYAEGAVETGTGTDSPTRMLAS